MHFCLGKKQKNKHMAAATKADKESVSLRILPTLHQIMSQEFFPW